MSHDWLDRKGNPITIQEFGRLREDPRYHRIGHDFVGGAGTEADHVAAVSTVWLGLDHSWLEQGPPLIFETMIFGGLLADTQWRYSTEEQALEGHRKAVVLADQAVRDADRLRSSGIIEQASKTIVEAYEELHDRYEDLGGYLSLADVLKILFPNQY